MLRFKTNMWNVCFFPFKATLAVMLVFLKSLFYISMTLEITIFV